MRARTHLALFAALLLLLSPALYAAYTGRAAQPVEPRARAIGYRSEHSAIAYRESLSTGDTGDVTEGGTGLGTVTSISCTGYAQVSVSGLATVSTTVAVLTCVRYAYDPVNSVWVGVSTTDATITADSEFTEGSTEYLTDTVYFDTDGANLVKIFIRSLTGGGSIDLYTQVN